MMIVDAADMLPAIVTTIARVDVHRVLLNATATSTVDSPAMTTTMMVGVGVGVAGSATPKNMPERQSAAGKIEAIPVHPVAGMMMKTMDAVAGAHRARWSEIETSTADSPAMTIAGVGVPRVPTAAMTTMTGEA